MEHTHARFSTKKPKVTFALNTPYSEQQWPSISPDIQLNIVDLLCSFLSPAGNHRLQHKKLSKGKRGKKRRKRNKQTEESVAGSLNNPAIPEVLKFVTIGFNTTTQFLEMLAQNQRHIIVPSLVPITEPKSAKDDDAQSDGNRVTDKPLAAVFVPCAEQPPILHSHLPLLIKTASLAFPSSPQTRLVALPIGAEARLSKALNIPRVSLVGLISDAPAASELIGYIRAHVPAIEIPWLQESAGGFFLPTVINTIHTTTRGTLDEALRTRYSAVVQDCSKPLG